MATPLQTQALQTQVHILASTNLHDACLRCIRCLQAMAEVRDKPSAAARMAFMREASTLEDALRGTPFGQAMEPEVLARLAPLAELSTLSLGTLVELRGPNDALYVVLTGAAEVVAWPSKKVRMLTVTVESASNLPGDSEQDRLDPYVVIKVGQKTYKSPVAFDAGPDPVWSYTTAVVYNGELEIEFTVMEHDSYSRDDVLGVASLSHIDFTGVDGYSGSLSLSPLDVGKADQTGELGGRGHTAAALGNKVSTHLIGSAEGSINVQLTWSAEVPLASTTPELAVSRTTDLAPSSTSTTLDGKLTMGSSGGPGILQHSKTKGKLVVKEGAEHNDAQLGRGQHFGVEEGGGALRAVEDCQVMVVPRLQVSEAFRSFREQRRDERDACLRKHMPGMHGLDTRSFSNFAASFQFAVLPHGHELCTAGPVAGDSKRVYLIMQGTCSIIMPPAPREHAGSPPRGVQEPFRSSAAPVSLGMIGAGAVVGYASALFAVPEPFTAVVEEPVSVLWLSTEQRPMAVWPRDVVHRLQEMLKTRTEWHIRRAQVVQASVVTSNGLKSDGGDRMPVGRTVNSLGAASPRELSRLAREPKGLSPAPHTALAKACGGPGLGGHQVESPPPGPHPRGLYELNVGLGRCKTPWGTWNPSGMMPLPQESVTVQPGQVGSRAYRKKVVLQRGVKGLPRSFGLTSASGIEEQKPAHEMLRRKVNLKCPSDWQCMSGLTSAASLEKMFRQQVRTSTIQGPMVHHASLGHSLSEGALRRTC